MIRQDYILRLIEQFFAAVSEIIRQRKAKQYSGASATIDRTLKSSVGFDLNFLGSMSDRDVVAMIDQGLLSVEQVVIVAALLDEEAKLHAAEGRSDPHFDRSLKSLNLLLEVFRRGDDPLLGEFLARIDSLSERLGPDELPADTQRSLAAYFESRGKFSKAEDWLFEWAEQAVSTGEALAYGEAFYQRLSAKTDRELEEGRLPRDEVQEGLEGFRQRLRARLPANAGKRP